MRALLLPALVLLLAACHKSSPQPTPAPDPLSLLPPETQSGAGTFGCLINGQAYVNTNIFAAHGDWISYYNIAISGTLNKNVDYLASSYTISLLLNGELINSNSSVFTIAPPATPYPTLAPGIRQVYAFALQNNCKYSGTYFKSGQVTLTKFDGVARTASGRFAFTLYEPGGCDTLRVTNGRFDVKF